MSERALRGLMHATAELKRRIKGWILEQGEIAFKVPKTAVREPVKNVLADFVR